MDRIPRGAAALALAAASLVPAALASPAAAADDPPAQGQADERAAAVAERVMAALGGEQAWAATRFIRFTFVGRRPHVWDKWTGRHRVEGTTQEGKPWVVLHNVVTREGRAFLDGQPLAGEEAKTYLDRAYSAWINDTYWLLAPFKLRDPGVTLAWDGEEALDGRPHDRLALAFAGVGETPGDRYWMWVDRETGLVDRWAYVLEDQPADATPTAWSWEGWQTYGKVKLAPLRAMVGGDRKLELGPIEVDGAVPDEVFERP
jgi:hypothetical protein